MVALLDQQWQQGAGALLERGAAGGARAPVVVSLTSYPPRFATLHLTLKSLLLQSLQPQRVELWIAHADMAQLPPAVRALEAYGLQIKACDDLRSYKKLIPALHEDSNVAIVTADDDIYYWPDWLRQLVEAQVPGQTEVICHRMHRIRLGTDGLPLPYADWELDARVAAADALHFPTGIGGVLYPAHVFPATVFDRDAYTALCPQGDDIWFFWMAGLGGARFKRVAAVNRLHCWEGSQDSALWQANLVGRYNDVQIQAMIGAYGFATVAKAAV